jgi:adenosylhomocysteinase
VVAGYGWVGRGIANRFSGMGARVTVVEIDPVRAIEALMDGHQVMTAGDAAAWGEVFVTATGNINVFREEHFRAMTDGSLLANSGHFDAELDLAALTRLAEVTSARSATTFGSTTSARRSSTCSRRAAS